VLTVHNGYTKDCTECVRVPRTSVSQKESVSTFIFSLLCGVNTICERLNSTSFVNTVVSLQVPCEPGIS